MIITIPTETKSAIAQYAHSKPDEEVCGLVLSDDSVVYLENIADSKDDFRLSPDILPRYQDSVQYVFHSHYGEGSPALLTPADISGSRACGVPYLLYHTLFDQWDLWGSQFLHPYPLVAKTDNPKSLQFYLGWPWQWGRSDCLTLLRCYYKGMFDIHIHDFERVSTENEFHRQLMAGEWNQYDEELGSQGFEKIYEGSPYQTFPFQKHDLILMKLQGKMPHHIGILVDEKKMHFIHHLERGSFSKKDPYMGGRIRQTHSIWRHTKLIVP